MKSNGSKLNGFPNAEVLASKQTKHFGEPEIAYRRELDLGTGTSENPI